MGEQDPMSFLYLDMISTVLLEDVNDLSKDFDIKMSFIREQEKNCLDNIKELQGVHQFVNSIKNCVLKTEVELQEHEAALQQVEEYINRFEATHRHCNEAPNMPQLILRPSNYLVFLKLMLSAHYSAAQCNNLMEEIEDYNNTAAEHLNPIRVIAKMIDYHVKALESVENNINEIQQKVTAIETEYAEIAKKYNINNLSPKLTCEMANAFNNI